jgi:hypothetical protein
MNDVEIVYKPGLEERGKSLSEELDRLEAEADALRPWHLLKRWTNKRALNRTHEEHGDAIDWGAPECSFDVMIERAWKAAKQSTDEQTQSPVTIELSDRVDGSGMHYGWAHWGDASVRLDVMPPRPLFRPDFRMDEYQPDDTRYVIFADGEEVGRIEAKRETLIPALTRLLMDGEGDQQ